MNKLIGAPCAVGKACSGAGEGQEISYIAAHIGHRLDMHLRDRLSILWKLPTKVRWMIRAHRLHLIQQMGL